MKTYSLALSIVAAAAAMTSTAARAGECGALTLDDTPQDVIIGQFGPVNYTHPLGEWIAPTGVLGVCWRDVGGAWNLERIGGCDTSTPAGDTFVLRTRGGADYVSTLLEEQTFLVAGLNWLRARLLREGWTHGMTCGAGGDAIAPWDPSFEFGVKVQLGEGADKFYGTPNDDIGESNFTSFEFIDNPDPFGTPRMIPVWHAPADESTDLLCGGGGDDELLGDADDDYQDTAEEWLDGGDGNDFCDGDPPDGPYGINVGGSTSDVVKTTCETHEDAFVSNSLFSCDEAENPIEWFNL